MNNPKILISGDYNAFKQEGWNGAGAYMISGNYKSENISMPIYIGSSVDFKKRITGHLSHLKLDKHCNSPLQNHWNKYGAINFIWFALEVCPVGRELELEQKYFDQYRPFISERGGFNIKKTPINNKHEEREYIGRSFSIVNPLGELICDTNIAEFCKKNKLNKSSFHDLLNGHFSQYLGWRLPSPETIGVKSHRTRIVVSPKGEVIEIKNVAKFCECNNLSYGQFFKMVQGKSDNYNGWRIATKDNIGVPFIFSKDKDKELLSPEGEVIRFKKYCDFCSKYGLSWHVVTRLLSGKRKFFNGWSKPTQTQIENFRQKNPDNPDTF